MPTASCRARRWCTLAQMMDAHPEVGIIQALPLLAGRDTLFARLLQFAVRLSGPMFASGLAFWQLGESNYWGHNAIIRLRAFADYCSLPSLPRLAAVRRGDHEPRHRRGGLHAPRRLRDLAGAGYRRQLGRGAVQCHRLSPPAIAAGHRAICSTSACMPMRGPALAEPPAHADRRASAMRPRPCGCWC